VEFKAAKRRVVEAIRGGTYEIEPRLDASKNLLGTIEDSVAAEIVLATKGTQATHSPHHDCSTVTVWVFRPNFQSEDWYAPLTAGYVPNEALLGSKVTLRPTLIGC
jgi:hypothetical protein